jgi:hypothetical protein
MPQILNVIKHHWHILEANPQCRQVFKEMPQIVYRKSKNLKNFLVRAQVNKDLEEKINTLDAFLGLPKRDPLVKKFTFICKTFPCQICNLFKQKNGTFTASTTQKTYVFSASQNCQAKNVVYCITCKNCKKQYIGETKRPFRKRILEHLRDIRNYDPKRDLNLPVARHFNSQGHHSTDVQCHIIEIIKKDPDNTETTVYRKNREQLWIHKFRTISPEGINKMES